jgi:hypothetical protein
MMFDKFINRSKEPKKGSKGGGLFSRSTPIEFPPKSIFFDYKEGEEKVVRENAQSESHTMVRELGWGKVGVDIRLFKITSHPNLEPGYIYEVQKSGDGGSYIEAIVEAFKKRDVKQVWIECAKDKWAFVELKNGKLDTVHSPIPPEEGDHILSFNGKVFKGVRPMFAENYLFYYIGLMLLFVSTISVVLAALFKYVWFDETKRFVDKKYYGEEMLMPISTLRSASSTETFSLSAVRYVKAKGWYFIIREMANGELIEYEQRLKADGSLQERVKLRSTPIEQSALSITELTEEGQQ